ncbi:hypothetical protein [Ancylobacter sp. FA202]|uniref:hypothetical protein n=1 Tax=Ancylobacter sp. FA202 TaxID=1111106 RepID=UPI00037B04A2|nr:hypothetical protein [Ancylobacter sp. FA202]
MSADAPRRQGGSRALHAVFSLVLIALAAGAIFKGVAFARLGALEWQMERESARIEAKTGVVTGAVTGVVTDSRSGAREAQAQRAALAQWHDAWGLRDKARQLSFSLGQHALEPPSSTGLEELVAVLEVDPLRSASWMDLAQLTWPDLALRPTSLAAWELSRLTGPYEYAEMLRRVNFLARRWIFADADSKRHFVYDVTVMRRFPEPFLRSWQRLLASLPAAQSRLLNDELKAPSP